LKAKIYVIVVMKRSNNASRNMKQLITTNKVIIWAFLEATRILK